MRIRRRHPNLRAWKVVKSIADDALRLIGTVGNLPHLDDFSLKESFDLVRTQEGNVVRRETVEQSKGLADVAGFETLEPGGIGARGEGESQKDEDRSPKTKRKHRRYPLRAE
jgi:hypothetical protein